MNSNDGPDPVEERLAFWGEAYISSTKASDNQAHRFARKHDFFAAYLHEYVAFNNLYRLLGGFDTRPETNAIKCAIDAISPETASRIYSGDYLTNIQEINEARPEQFEYGPDVGASGRGIVNMQDYYLGKSASTCIRHVKIVASLTDSAVKKQRTLVCLASILLYTIKNNQFHAVKGYCRPEDIETLRLGYCLLEPIVKAIIPVAEQKIHDIQLRQSLRST